MVNMVHPHIDTWYAIEDEIAIVPYTGTILNQGLLPHQYDMICLVPSGAGDTVSHVRQNNIYYYIWNNLQYQ